MQIDGHHAATYVAARLAGFSHSEADVISYAAQYVDDANNGGAIHFDDSAYLYYRIAYAHSMIDYNNLIDVENHLAWLPFHFLPGNGLLPAGSNPLDCELDKMVCKPDSPIARDMLRAALKDRGTPRELMRLGITMHVYADTFAHQGFIGAMSVGNVATNVTCGDSDIDEQIKALTKKELFRKMLDGLKASWQFLAASAVIIARERKSPIKFWQNFFSKEPLGHAAVDTYPDQPYLVWEYNDYQGNLVRRDNPVLYIHALNMMVRAMQAWRANDYSMNLQAYPGMALEDTGAIEKLVRECRSPDGGVRHAQWLDAIRQGDFSFGSAELQYIPKGQGSWKQVALGTQKPKDSGLEVYPYTEGFLTSRWKLFHDAIQIHRSDVVHDILPRYGICAA